MRRHTRAGALLLLAAPWLPARAGCPEPRELPGEPREVTDLNGVAWPDLCFEDEGPQGEEHFFVIGDWGGVLYAPTGPPVPANQASRRGRPFIWGVDDKAQQLVAEQMMLRASTSLPRFVLNAGDNFYWGGVTTTCGESDTLIKTGQWEYAFENIYTGPDLAGKQWMGVLGNHDYGGYMFTAGWDQAIMYTWKPGGRWLTPALYWSRRVLYKDFSMDLFFVDSNVNDAHYPLNFPSTNMCSLAHNGEGASCSGTGPPSVWDCHEWFQKLWQEQIPWLEAGLGASTADWQVVVTHFPPDFMIGVWAQLAEKYGIDLIVGGHRHQEEVHYKDGFAGGLLGSTAWVVAGGGGGITSECTPRLDGQDDCYGFMDVAVTKEKLRIDAISHGGVLRSSTEVWPRKSLIQRQPTTTTTTEVTTATTTVTLTSTQSVSLPTNWTTASDNASAVGNQSLAETTPPPASGLAAERTRSAGASPPAAQGKRSKPFLRP